MCAREWASGVGFSGEPSPRPSGTRILIAELTQDFVLDPIDVELSLGTPVLGYPHRVPPGPTGRWLSFWS